MSKFSTVLFQNVVLIIFDFVGENVSYTTFRKPFYFLRAKYNVNSLFICMYFGLKYIYLIWFYLTKVNMLLAPDQIDMYRFNILLYISY